MINKDSKKRLFEVMESVNPDFNSNTIEEVLPQQPAQPVQQQRAQPQQPVQPQQPAQPSDVRTLGKANQAATSVQNAGKRINTATEFPEAFRMWFSSLGYKPDNPAISIMKVRTEVERVMKSMGFK